LTLPDMHFVSLVPAMEGLIVPSKFYGIAAAGRPSLFIGDLNGEIAAIIKEYNCGVSARVGDANEVARQITRLSENAQLTDAMGRAARRAYDEKYNKKQSIDAWRELLHQKLANRSQVMKLSIE
jgi:glycosyltransferase involved in cell wall biosynthesis